MRIIRTSELFAAVFIACILSGCATGRLVPATGAAASGTGSVSKTERGVTLTAVPSAWRGEPRNLSIYLTPVFIRIENQTEFDVSIRYEDVALFDESRTQFLAIAPDTVARIAESGVRRQYALRAYSSLGFGYGFGFSRFYRRGFSPFFYNSFSYDPFWRFPYYSDYSSYYSGDSSADVIAEALVSGTIKPKSAAEGFVYLKKIPPKAGGMTMEVEFKIEGDANPSKIALPLAVELRRYY
ncbi:MAG: hypothetical protein ACT4NX_04820 [Deltaproteobacteria bacterium]